MALSNFVSLSFNDQKNGVKGKSIGHGALGHPTACAIVQLHQCVRELQQKGATADTSLASFKEGTQ